MIQEKLKSNTFICFYTKNGAYVTGLTVTCSLLKVSTNTVIATGGATAVGLGIYKYAFTSSLFDTEGLYVTIFNTAGGVDMADLPSAWYVGADWVQNMMLVTNYTTPDNISINLIKTKVDTLNNTNLSLLALESTSQLIKTKVDTLNLSGIALETTNQLIKTKVDSLSQVNITMSDTSPIQSNYYILELEHLDINININGYDPSVIKFILREASESNTGKLIPFGESIISLTGLTFSFTTPVEGTYKYEIYTELEDGSFKTFFEGRFITYRRVAEGI